MLILELFGTCVHRTVAAAAVSSIGGAFNAEVTKAAPTAASQPVNLAHVQLSSSLESVAKRSFGR